jgi:hypothetical protein
MSTTPTPVRPRTESSGWAIFVATYLLIAGVLNVVWGIAALSNKAYFTSGGLLWSSLNTWGWVAIIVGAFQMLGASLVAARSAAGAVIAGFLAFLGIMLNFLSIGAYPVWSGILLVIDALIVWAVTVHGEEFVS